MKIIEPSVTLLDEIDAEKILKKIELCGRVAYKSENNISADSAEKFIRNIIKYGHESVLEHVSLSFRIICDRGVMAELTRHRLASFTVESTRFNDYSSDKFGGELTFIRPCFWNKANENFEGWSLAMQSLEKCYKVFRSEGATPQEARSILPNSLKTELIMTASLREWRTVLKLRTAKDAHPQMKQIANMILKIFKDKLPVIVEDIGNEK